MLVTIVGSRGYVTISRRNLRQLNAIVDDPNGRHGCLTRKDENGVSLVLQVEDDADHYGGERGYVRVREHGVAGQPSAVPSDRSDTVEANHV
jgi:hypothetical protein